MQRFIGRFFDIRAGEGAAALQAALAIFTLLCGHTMLETARDTLFLQRLQPARLTLVYALIAALTLLASPLGVSLARRFGRRNALVTTLLIAAYGTALLYLLPLTAASVIVLYTWTGLLGTLLVLQFWLFVSELLTLSQGKRLLGPIAAGGALGAVTGAGLSVLLLAWLRTSSLVLVAAALFVITALVLTSVKSPDSESPLPRAVEQAKDTRLALGLLRREPYVLRLAALGFLSAAALLAMDYLFKSAAARVVPRAELGTFFGTYYAILNAASLAMQLLAAGPLIRRLGVVPALMILPGLLFTFGVAAALSGVALWAVLLIKSSDGALRHSIQRVASELIQMPLSKELQERVKSFVDGPLARVAQALAAGALLAITSLEGRGERWVALLGTGLALLWFLTAMSLKKPYLQRFREALARPGFDHQGMLRELDVDAVEAVLEALSSPDPTRVLGAMELLHDKGRVRLIPALVLLHQDEAVLAHALSILSATDRTDWLVYAERLSVHASEEVRAAALRALSLRGNHAALERGLLDPSAAVRAHATFWLVTREEVAEPLSDARVVALMQLSGQEERTAAELALLSAIQAAPHTRWTEVVLVLSRTPDARMFEQVALAMVELKDPRFVPILIPRLGTRDGRGAVRDALVALGEAPLDALELELNNPATPKRVRVHIPRTISAFGNQRAADILLEQLAHTEQPGLVRYKALRGLGRLVTAARVRVDPKRIDPRIRENLSEHLRVLAIRAALTEPARDSGPSGEPARADSLPPVFEANQAAERSLRLVLGLLDDKCEQSLERAFRLLQIRHKNEDLRGVYFALKSGDRRKRAHALEFLDLLTATWQSDGVGRDVRELLLIITDELSDAERSARAARFLLFRPRTYAEALSALLNDPDEAIAAFAAYHALEVGSFDLTQQVAEALRERPSLNRANGAQTLFPAPLELGHAT